MFDSFRQDLLYGARNLWQRKLYSSIVVLTLALTIGGSTAMFSVVNAVLIRSLPYRSPERLVMIWNRYGKSKPSRAFNSPPDFFDRKRESRTLENIAAMEQTSLTLLTGGEPQRIRGARVSASIFQTLGMFPTIGRPFTDEEDRPGRNFVVIISHRLWNTQFGSDPRSIGRSLNLSGNLYTVIGVMPDSFRFPFPEAEFWIPIAFTAEQAADSFRGNEFLSVIARAKPEFTIQQVQSDMDRIAANVGIRVPDRRDFLNNSGWGAIVIPLRESIVGDVQPALLVLMAAVTFVLFIACANVANLILARTGAREKEFGIRTALGAGRLRLIRLVCVEALLLTMAGAAIGLLLAQFCVGILPTIAPENLPRAAEINIDRAVLAYSFLVSLLTALCIAALPALRASMNRPFQSLNLEGRSSNPKSMHHMKDILVIAQIALALVLSTGAVLFMKSFVRLNRVDPGFQTTNRLTIAVSLPQAQYAEDAGVIDFYRRLLESIRSLPGVQAAGATASLPISGENWTATFSVEGKQPQPGEPQPGFEYRMVTPGYFRAMGIPLLEGRDFTDHDRVDSTRVAIIDQSLANRFWKNQNPIGKRIAFSSSSNNPKWREVVAVVGHVKNSGLNEAGGEQIYFPHAQLPDSTMILVIQTTDDPIKHIAAIRSRVKYLDPNLPLYQIATMERVVSASVAQPRFHMLLFALFAAISLIIAAVGIYGVLSYSVTQRRREIGIRMALGARPENVLSMIIRQSMLVSASGMIAGLVASLALSRFVRSLLFRTQPVDPLLYALTASLAMLIAFLATAIPAKRAAGLDPLRTLRDA